MAALTPALGVIGNIVGTVTAIDSTLNTLGALGGKQQQDQQNLALQQLKDRQALELKIQKRQAQADKEKIYANAQSAEQERLKALKRAVASRKAKYGAQGISTNNGSAEAVLLGLFEETEDDANAAQRLDAIKLGAIDQELKNQKALNLLQVSQLKQQYDLETKF